MNEVRDVTRTTTKLLVVLAATVMVAVLLAGTALPASADPVDGTGAVVSGTVTENSYSWSASLNLEGSFALGGRTYGFFGTLYAYNSCCSSLGSSGSGTWHFSGTLLSQDSVVSGYVGAAFSSSASMTYTRTELVPGALYSLDMRLSGPATAYLPDGGSVGFNVDFLLHGQLSDNNPLDGLCGPYPGCSYNGTYSEVALPSGPAPYAGTGAVVSGTVTENSYSWSASLSLEGSFVVSGQTYGYFGTLYAYNYCCSSLGSSGSGTWYFSGTLFLPTGVGGTFSSSASMSYTRTEVVPGTEYMLDMRLSGPATAYLPDGRDVDFDVSFAIGGHLVDNSPLDGFCGSFPGCSYQGTYNQHDRPSVLAASGTGGATSSGVTVGWGDSSAYGGSVCVSATGDCRGASVYNICPMGYCE